MLDVCSAATDGIYIGSNAGKHVAKRRSGAEPGHCKATLRDDVGKRVSSSRGDEAARVEVTNQASPVSGRGNATSDRVGVDPIGGAKSRHRIYRN